LVQTALGGGRLSSDGSAKEVAASLFADAPTGLRQTAVAHTIPNMCNDRFMTPPAQACGLQSSLTASPRARPVSL